MASNAHREFCPIHIQCIVEITANTSVPNFETALYLTFNSGSALSVANLVTLSPDLVFSETCLVTTFSFSDVSENWCFQFKFGEISSDFAWSVHGRSLMSATSIIAEGNYHLVTKRPKGSICFVITAISLIKVNFLWIMGKPQYEQKFRKEWLSLFDFKTWLQPVSNDPKKAYCKYCKSEINARLADLKKHSNRDKHKAAINSFSSARQRRIDFKEERREPDGKKVAEGKLALFCAVHGNMHSSDHLGELCTSLFPGSSAAHMRIHRTKCTQIIANVFAPHFREKLRRDIGVKNFSLILDESTDISVTKLLGVVIRYCSEETGKFVSTFLELVELTSGTAEGIVEGIEKVMGVFNLDLKKLVGIGADNASVMTGVNNGVFSVLKKKYNLPQLVLIRCVCHSLQLAVSHATEETLPRNLDFLIRETYNWFSYSAMRQSAYKELFSLINEGASPLKILQLSNTRWISMEPAINRILSQWLELKCHFEMARRKDNCYTAEILYNNYNDNRNKVYLIYLQQILSEVQRTNKAFESESVDSTKLLEDLGNLIKSIASKILIPTASTNVFKIKIDDYLDPNPYLGYAFNNAIAEFGINPQDQQVLKDRCIQFTIKLCKELQQRLPSNFTLLESMSLLSVKESLKIKKHKLPITNLAKEFTTDHQTISAIESQWYNLSNIMWTNTQSTEKLWMEVSTYVDACGENPFAEIGQFAVGLLSLPYSNAEVERVFSQMNIVKNKLRNRLKLKTLISIMTIRYGLRRIAKCCNSYTIPEDVLQNIGTKKVYVDAGDKASTSRTDTVASGAEIAGSDLVDLEESDELLCL